MLNQPTSSARQLGRYFLAAPLVLALSLGYSSAQAQVLPTPEPAPKPVPQNVTYYLDGQKSDQAAIAKIEPSDISYIQILKGSQQQQIFGTSTTDGVAVVTTKTNANSPAILALNKRISAAAPLVPATPEQEAAMATAKAYITKNYPNAKLESIFPIKEQPRHTKVVFTENGKRVSLLLDSNGQPVKQ